FLRSRRSTFEPAGESAACLVPLKRVLVAAGRVGGYNPANPMSFSAEAAPMAEITGILSAIEQGDPHAAEQLLPLVYGVLRKLAAQDRKSTRLNSSHLVISYAVFCLKKKSSYV